MADLKSLRLDPQTLIILLIIVALLGIGYGVGHYRGVGSVQSQIIDQGSQVSVAGTVQSANDSGFVVKVDGSATGASAGIGGGGAGGRSSEGPGGQATSGTWTVKYGKQGANISSSGSGSGNQSLKKGDKVQVSGTPTGKHTMVAQTVSKIVPPTPAPSAAPGEPATKAVKKP